MAEATRLIEYHLKEAKLLAAGWERMWPEARELHAKIIAAQAELTEIGKHQAPSA